MIHNDSVHFFCTTVGAGLRSDYDELIHTIGVTVALRLC